MRREFWEGLWAEGMTPWHRREPNVALSVWLSVLALPSSPQEITSN